MNVIPFKAQHALDIEKQQAQQYLAAYLTPALARSLEGPWAFSGVVGDDVVACAGVVEQWAGRGVAWSYLGEAAGPHFVAIHRAVKRFLDVCPLRRIEMNVDCDFPEAHRWARMLGFEMECERMRSYRPDGGDMALYARVH